MHKNLILKRKLSDNFVFKGTAPGIYDYDVLVDADTDGYDGDKLMFKFRRGVIPAEINDNFSDLADLCLRKYSLRSDAAGPSLYEESRILGFDLNKRTNNFVSESQFTKDHHGIYKKNLHIIELISTLYKTEFPSNYYFQKNLKVDPHFLIGSSIFSQCIINRSFRTCLHRDKGNVKGTISNLICLGDNSYTGGYLVLPEYRIAIDLRPQDYLGFLGEEIWHGNTEIKGTGIRLSLVCYLKKDILGKTYDGEMLKRLAKIENKFNGDLNSEI